MKSTYRWTVLAAVLATTAAFPATARAQCAGGAPPVGNIGIAQLECDCVLAAPTSDAETRFWTEPRVVRLERGGAADGVLRTGDVILSVNGQSIMTAEGARALTRTAPSQRVALTVRRDGVLQNVTVTPTAACPTDTRLLGMSAPLQAGRVTAGVTAVRGVRIVGATPVSPARVAEVTRVPTSAPPGRVAPTAQVPVRAGVSLPRSVTTTRPVVPLQNFGSAWIGLAFNCRDCTLSRVDGEPRWVFPTAPEVYSVEQGSPAYNAGMRRGDVLTHVDGRSITTAEGGRRWAALKPGDAARVTYRRDGQSRSVTLRPVEPPSRAAEAVRLNALRATSAVSDSAAARLIRQYETTAAQQEALLQRLTSQRQAAGGADRQAMDRLVSEYAERQSQLRVQQSQLVEELVRLRQADALQVERVLTPAPSPLPTPSSAAVMALRGRLEVAPTAVGTQRLRYSGTFGGSDVVVHGVDSVTITEVDGELIITTRDATIRIRRQ